MDRQTLDFLNELIRIAALAGNSRGTIEKFLTSLRSQFVFDNVAVYLFDERTASLEIMYARAIGRARNAEADAAWGETFANQVFAQRKILKQDPRPDAPTNNRLDQAYMLGIPIGADGFRKGALVFVRFGGPIFTEDHVQIASAAADLLNVLFERAEWRDTTSELRELKRQMQLQEDFVSTISHELRTPLGFIKGYSTSLLRQDTHWDAETQKEFLTIIDEEADRLSLLIENVLESARLQSKTLPLRFQPVRLDAVMRDVVMRIRSRYKDLQVNMDAALAPPIQGDGVRIAQVFENLFTNALKYASGAPITISLSFNNEAVTVVFKDGGPGIPPESLPLIFERFFRARNEKTVTGSGLGLYICKQIIQAHRGKIWAESTPGEGATFYIQLPINPAN
ncbi:MAG TPA: ATP-binding protein [Anaerolineales bacterium]|jgi:signal transduction histidine kinase|nr:ATP-binding protein [Anaerolineales bacterium]HQX16183.1 ATP-binding protein [Anaerolineales bacterium]